MRRDYVRIIVSALGWPAMDVEDGRHVAAAERVWSEFLEMVDEIGCLRAAEVLQVIDGLSIKRAGWAWYASRR